MSEYKLLEPIKVGNSVFKNRIVMPPMETRLNMPNGDVTREMIDYYAERAKGGAAALIVENTFIDDKESRSSLISSGLYSDHLIAGKNLLAEAIKDNGALAILQLSHGGRQAVAAATGLQPVAPSAIASKVIGRMPRALEAEEIETIEDAFADAAERAQTAGFDGVEIHGAHGYLIFSFLSPYSNVREDSFGGSVEKRARFAKNIMRKVRSRVGDGFIVGFRISGSDFIPDGFSLEMACETVPMIEEYIDYIHVSGGVYETSAFSTIVPLYGPMGGLIEHAAAIKKCVNIPVITVGALDVKLGEKALGEGKADIVAFGRPMIADPDIPNKIMQDRIEDIRPCFRGHEGCLSRFPTGCTIRCEVNPACGREREYKIEKAAEPKRVLIAGGGLSGMEAARVASLMGHKVTLMEKSDVLGGHIIEGSVPQFKDKVAELLEWLKHQLRKSDVEIKMNCEVTKEALQSQALDVLIIAVGSEYQSGGIDGADNAVFADKALLCPNNLGKNVVVVGGGLIGAETALMLAQQYGKKVVILEQMGDILQGHEAGCKESLVHYLNEAGVKIMCGYKVDNIDKQSVVCSSRTTQTCLNTDSVVLANGLFAKRDTVAELLDFANKTIEIGDCVSAGRIYDCFHDAWKAVRKI